MGWSGVDGYLPGSACRGNRLAGRCLYHRPRGMAGP